MTITINDKPYKLVWGMGAIEIYCDLMDCDLEGLGFIDDKTKPLLQIKAMTTMFWAAVKNGCDTENTDCDVTYKQLQCWLDEAPQETANEIMTDFAQSKIFGKTLISYLTGLPEPEQQSKKKSRSVK